MTKVRSLLFQEAGKRKRKLISHNKKTTNPFPAYNIAYIKRCPVLIKNMCVCACMFTLKQ